VSMTQIKTLWKEFFFSYKEVVALFSISVHAIVFLKNIFSTIYDEVKLILTSSSIIIILVPNKESQAHLELHKALPLELAFGLIYKYTNSSFPWNNF